MMILRGVPICPGMAAGRVLFAGRDIPTLEAAGTPEQEREKLDRAVVLARQRLAHLPAQQQWLEDRDIMEFCWELVASGTAAVNAWHRAFSRVADRMAESPGELFARRAAEVREAGRHVLRLLASGRGQATPEDAIVIAHDLSAADLASLDATNVRGLATVGDPSAQVAAFARSRGIPAAAALDARVLDLPPSSRVVLDGTRGELTVGPGRARRLSRFARLAGHRAASFLGARRRR